jgi:HEAT repeat protein
LFDTAMEEDPVRVAAAENGLGDVPISTILRELCSSEDRWLRACALHAIGELRLGEIAEPLAAALRAPDAVVRETAAWAQRRIEEPA